MRDFIVRSGLGALFLALLPGLADAAGLGRLTMISALGQPLHAEVELVSVTPEEMATLTARLAPPDAYRQANLQYNAALTGARISIEKRPDGRPYLRITSNRPVNEPFIDLLVEITWAAGRLTREYTALLDPPGVAPEPPAPTAVAPPPVIPAPVPRPPVVAAPVRAVAAAPREYGPIERGETLGKIARSVMPEGVTLEQMLVGLYRSNPEAFVRNNLNLVRAGRILRVPDREEVAAIGRAEAVTEYRAHVADWSVYRQRLADAAGVAPAEGRAAARGKITAMVEDPAAGPKDVVKLSPGVPPEVAEGKGKPLAPAARVRALEEELIAREKALAEANERIAELEKTIKDMQRLIELKSAALAAVPKPAETPQPEAEAPKPAPTADVPQPAPKPKVVVPPPPPPEPALLDQIMEAVGDPLYLAAGGGVIVLGGLAFWMARRRRAGQVGEFETERVAPAMATAGAGAAETTAGIEIESAGHAPEAAPAGAADEVDPLAEAEVYMAYGRDGQAEEILREALARNPKREDVQLKLLEIYAARKDSTAFGRAAAALHKLSGGRGETWLKAAAMGYALDPANALYEAGKGAPAPAPGSGPITGTDLDLDLGLGAASGPTTTDITLDAGLVEQASQTVVDTGAMPRAEEAAPLMPDFTLDVPLAGEATRTDIALDAAQAGGGGAIDFQIDLPKIEAAPADDQPTVVNVAPPEGGLDFKLDIPDVNLDLGAEPRTVQGPAGGERDGHWYDVQTKFDLAKAYQEMGDSAGAKEILQEVIREGDAEQQAQAKALLQSLG